MAGIPAEDRCMTRRHPRPKSVLSDKDQLQRAEANRLRLEAQAVARAAAKARHQVCLRLWEAITPQMKTLIDRWVEAAVQRGIRGVETDVETDDESLAVSQLIFPSEEDDVPYQAWDSGNAYLSITISANTDPVELWAGIDGHARLGGPYQNGVSDRQTLLARTCARIDLETTAGEFLAEAEQLDSELVVETIVQVLETLSEASRGHCSCGRVGVFELDDRSMRCRSCFSDEVSVALGQSLPRVHNGWRIGG